MRPIGFSTGALAKGDYSRGIDLQTGHPGLRAIELSALREHELQPLVQKIDTINLSHFDYISVHAPSKLVRADERAIFEMLRALPDAWPIVVHPEIVRTPGLWSELGARLCLENMDNRKTTGRTLSEVRELLNAFPEATFCLDLGHARQIDPTMATAIRMLQEFGDRLRQLHVSEVGPRSDHQGLSALAIYAFELVAGLVPDGCPVIIESVIEPELMDAEVAKVVRLFGERNGEEKRSFSKTAMSLA